MQMHSTVDPQDALATLKAAEEWLSKPEHWTDLTWWVANGTGRVYDVESIDYVCRTCLDGAFFYVCGQEPGMEILPAWTEVKRVVGTDPIALNSRGYDATMVGLRQTIKTLEQEQAS